MGAIIGYRSRVIFTSNGEWEEAMADALAIARRGELSETEKKYVLRFDQEMNHLFSGYCPFFERLFPTDEEKIFWAKAWQGAARAIVAGDLPGQEGRDDARRVFIDYWCANILSYLLKGSEADARSISRSRLGSQDAALADGERELFELEWERRLEEANKRGIMPVAITKSGYAKCPFCKEGFSVRDPADWNGRRHIHCLTRLNPRPIESFQKNKSAKGLPTGGNSSES